MLALEELWVSQARAGDLEAFGRLVERHQARVFNLLCKLVGDRQEAEDLAQDVFLQAFQALPGYRGEAAFATWLYRIAVNRSLDHLRRLRSPARRPVSLDGLPAEGVRPEPVASGAGPEQEVVGREARRRVREEVAALPENYRLPVILHHFQGLSLQEVSQVLQLPIRTVETRLYRAKKTLRQRLKDLWPGGEAGAQANQPRPVSGYLD